ncbi:hypothetical protein OMG47_001429 [Listeria monocytogenes]|nr:hypothetical protein [Listeria monocytogenes]EJI1915018.1 hypothetical protein [Listeria monocytogenes]EKA7966946.1 hypothetical protein [Listeria monocytogenes]
MATIKKSQVRDAIRKYEDIAIEGVTQKYDEKTKAFKLQKIEDMSGLRDLHEAHMIMKKIIARDGGVGGSLSQGLFWGLRQAPTCKTVDKFKEYLIECVYWPDFPEISEILYARRAEKSEIYKEYDKVRELMKSIPQTQKCIAELERLGFDLSDLKPEVTKAVAIIEVDKTKLGLVKKEG